MDTRSQLVRLALAGDFSSARAFIAQNYPLVAHLALTILDDPTAAAHAARAAGAAQLEHLQEYPGPEQHTAWLYDLTLQACRRELRFQRLAHRIPPILQKYLLPPALPADLPSLPAPTPLLSAVSRLDEPQRLTLVLRYAHDLHPHEIAQVLHWRDRAVQDRLAAARARLRPPSPPAIPESQPIQGLRHAQAETLLAAAADYRITDADAQRLQRHLRDCERCRAAAQRLAAFENELRAAFQARWAGELPPLEDPASLAQQRHQRSRAFRHFLSLGGALAFALVIAGLVVALPTLFPSNVMLPVTGAATALPPLHPALSPTPAFANLASQPTSRSDLLARVYPGQLAFIDAHNLTGHLFTFRPGVSGPQQLTQGFADDSAPAWSPGGRQIAFLSSSQAGGPNQVNVIQANGSGERQVWKPTFQIDTADPDNAGYPIFGPPHWSPDGKYLLSAVWVTSYEHYLAIMPLSGGPSRLLPVQGVDPDFVDWSPDGETIVYLADHGQNLWSWHPDQPLAAGQNPRPIYYTGEFDRVFGLSISPTSSQVALIGGIRDGESLQAELHFISITGTYAGMDMQMVPISLNVLTRTPLHNSDLAWSPDGKFLAFTPVFSDNDLVVGRILLANPAVKSTIGPLATMDRAVSALTWSPDSHWIAYAAGDEIWAASLDAYTAGQDHLVRLSSTPGYSLQWQPVN